MPNFHLISRIFLSSLHFFFTTRLKGVDTRKINLPSNRSSLIIVLKSWPQEHWFNNNNQAAKDLSLVYAWYFRYCFPPTEKFYSIANFKIMRQFWRFWKSDYFGRFFASISLVTTPFIVKIEHKYNLLILYIAVNDKYQEIFE